VLLCADLDTTGVIRMLRTGAQGSVVVRTERGALTKIFDVAHEELGTTTAAVLTDAAGERPRWGTPARLRDLPSGELFCCLDVTDRTSTLPALDIHRLVTDLLAAGATQRTISQALGRQPGWSRRSAYDFTLGVGSGPAR
jgi:hypothetical protein